jgi:hypothetical protein
MGRLASARWSRPIRPGEARIGIVSRCRHGLASGYRLRFASCQTFSPVIGDRAVDDGPAIDTFPCVKN